MIATGKKLQKIRKNGNIKFFCAFLVDIKINIRYKTLVRICMYLNEHIFVIENEISHHKYILKSKEEI